MTAAVEPGGQLTVGGLRLVDLAEQFGTPLFVYDEEHLRARCAEAVEAWGDGVAYATKAFLCRAMAQLAHQEGMCLDVSTGGELHVALRAGVAPERLVLHGNNKSAAELARAIEVGVGRIIVDSFDEIDRLRVLSVEAPAPPKVLVRVTPGVEAHTHEFVRTGHEDTKFGFSIASGAAWRAVEELRSLTGVDLPGWSNWWASTPTSAARSSMSARSSRLPRSSGASSPRSVSTSCALAAASGSRT